MQVSGKNFENLGLLECMSSILEQKSECLNRTQTLNFVFFIQEASSCEMPTKFCRPPALIENPVLNLKIHKDTEFRGT